MRAPETYRSPFSAHYWREAAAQLKSTETLLIAAMFVALRVVLRAIAIPVGPDLNLMLTFLPNALGGMLCGPVVAIVAGVVSDIAGFLINSLGGTFYPMYTLIEVLGSLLYALFLWRAPARVWRVAAAKLSVNIVCNILLTPIANAMMLGKAAVLTSLPRIVKNIVLFPVETVLIVLCVNAVAPFLLRSGRIPAGQHIALTKKHYALLFSLALLSAAIVAAYYLWLV